MEFESIRENDRVTFALRGQTGQLQHWYRFGTGWQLGGTLGAWTDPSGDAKTIFEKIVADLPDEPKWRQFLQDIQRQISEAEEASHEN